MKYIEKYLNGKIQLILFTLLFTVFILVVLPAISNYSEEAIGVSSSPDTSFNYSSGNYYEMLEQYGESGRNVYIRLRWTFDALWPLVYGMFLVSGILYFSEEIKYRQYLTMLPIAAVSFDYLENIFATMTMMFYPSKIIGMFLLLKISSTLKWSILLLAFIVYIYVIVKTTLIAIEKRKKNI